jgi:hypothetical protein
LLGPRVEQALHVLPESGRRYEADKMLRLGCAFQGRESGGESFSLSRPQASSHARGRFEEVPGW